MSFESARHIADAVLCEGDILYPYRKSATKNRFRWQFGIVAPRDWTPHGGDPWEMQVECLVEPCGSPTVDIAVRFLEVQESENTVERTVDLSGIPLEQVVVIPREAAFGGSFIRVSAERVDVFFKLRVRIENHTPLPRAAEMQRSAAMRHSLVGTHILLAVSEGAFVSLMDPPPSAQAAARSCSNLHVWPVLAGSPGSRDVMLASPIILEDYPAIAPESPGDFCDATEIDELLTLRVMTLTGEEKREACADGDRARGIIERCDSIPPEILERLHGAVRSLRTVSAEDFFNPPDEAPERASVQVGGQSVSRGALVRLAPKRMADSMDLFLAGRTATVQGVHHDVENRTYVAVTVEDDPAADIQGRVGRFFYFHPDELELVGKER